MFNNRPLIYPTNDTLRIRSRRGIPHFELDDGLYFITYRLADSIPRHVILALANEREHLLRAIAPNRKPSSLELAEAAARCGQKFDAFLDAGRGACLLRDRATASIVESSLRFHDQRLYELMAWSVMPNHVHVVMRLFLGRDLARVLHSWKSFTGNECNRILGREGRFWQREYFDRIVRDERELHRVIEYVVQNPAKAGLEPWPFAGCRF